MTSVKRLFLTVSLTVFLFSVSSVLAQNTPNLELSNAKLKPQPSFRFNPRFTAAKSGRDQDDYSPSEFVPPKAPNEKVIYPNGFIQVEAVARNTSAKTIKAIIWELNFFSDAKMSQLTQTYQLYSKRKIAAGETKTIKGKVNASGSLPVQGIVNSLPKQYQTVRPVRIEYTDGTVWEAH